MIQYISLNRLDVRDCPVIVFVVFQQLLYMVPNGIQADVFVQLIKLFLVFLFQRLNFPENGSGLFLDQLRVFINTIPNLLGQLFVGFIVHGFTIHQRNKIYSSIGTLDMELIFLCSGAHLIDQGILPQVKAPLKGTLLLFIVLRLKCLTQFPFESCHQFPHIIPECSALTCGE